MQDFLKKYLIAFNAFLVILSIKQIYTYWRESEKQSHYIIFFNNTSFKLHYNQCILYIHLAINFGDFN